MEVARATSSPIRSNILRSTPAAGDETHAISLAWALARSENRRSAALGHAQDEPGFRPGTTDDLRCADNGERLLCTDVDHLLLTALRSLLH